MFYDLCRHLQFTVFSGHPMQASIGGRLGWPMIRAWKLKKQTSVPYKSPYKAIITPLKAFSCLKAMFLVVKASEDHHPFRGGGSPQNMSRGSPPKPLKTKGKSPYPPPSSIKHLMGSPLSGSPIKGVVILEEEEEEEEVRLRVIRNYPLLSSN